MKNVKLIIFDLDGTLVDAYSAITRSLNFVMHRLGYPEQPDWLIRRQVGWGDSKLIEPFVNSQDLEKGLLLYRSHHKNSLRKYSHLFADAKAVLDYLIRKGYKLSIASNRPTKFSWILIRHLRLKRYFAYVLCADKLKHRKPHPEILNKIMRKFSVVPGQAVYIGDMTIDAQAGRRARVRTIIVSSGSSSEREINKEKPYKVIKRIAQLLNIL